MHMNMNPMALMQIKSMLESFRSRHPKFLQFFQAAAGAVTEDSLVEISLTTPDGKKMITNMKVTPEDLALFAQLKDLAG